MKNSLIILVFFLLVNCSNSIALVERPDPQFESMTFDAVTKNLLYEGDFPKHFKDLSNLWFENKVKIIGWSNNVEYYLKESDIQLIPSLWEGFGLVAVEGMSTGLPVVSSDVDGLREVLGKGNLSSFLVGNLKDEKEWRDKILMCIESLKKNPKVLQRAAREQSLQFSLDKMVKKYIKIYREFGLGECFDSVENVYKSRSK